MRKWKLRWVLALAGLAALLAAGALAPRRQPLRATRENYDHIREGMTRAEEEAILGPPGDYTTGPTTYYGNANIVSPWNVNATRPNPTEIDDPADWLTDAGWMCVVFDDSGKVASRGFDPCAKVRQGPLDNLL
jgi:hypothetical protein